MAGLMSERRRWYKDLHETVAVASSAARSHTKSVRTAAAARVRDTPAATAERRRLGTTHVFFCVVLYTSAAVAVGYCCLLLYDLGSGAARYNTLLLFILPR